MAKPPIKSHEIEIWAEGIRRVAEFPNVFCKLSGLVTEADWRHWTPRDIHPYLDVTFEAFGTERLMIGSDWPVCLVASPYSRVMDIIKNYLQRHSTETREAVLGANAHRFWRLKI